MTSRNEQSTPGRKNLGGGPQGLGSQFLTMDMSMGRGRLVEVSPAGSSKQETAHWGSS